MFFGVGSEDEDIGRFVSSHCEKCGSREYGLILRARYISAFFLRLFPVKTYYEYACCGCGETHVIEPWAAKKLIKKEFAGTVARLYLGAYLRTAALVCIAAAALVLPLTLIKNYGPEAAAIKSLADADGTYNIVDKNGSLLACVSVFSGNKTVTFLDRVSVLTGEPGADGTFHLHHYYAEAEDAKGNTILFRSKDDPGILTDRHNVHVRQYYYDASSGSYGYSNGVEDLSAIIYTAGKAVYPYSYYTTDGVRESYTVVLFLNPNQRLIATFLPSSSGGDPDQLCFLEIQEYEGERLAKDTTYYFDDNILRLAKSAGITTRSASSDILGFIADNKVQPYTESSFEYYKDTKVITLQTLSIPDQDGKMQSVTQRYDVSEKGGYYVQTASAG